MLKKRVAVIYCVGARFAQSASRLALPPRSLVAHIVVPEEVGLTDETSSTPHNRHARYSHSHYFERAHPVRVQSILIQPQQSKRSAAS